jgi:signal transduction histidine kinase
MAATIGRVDQGGTAGSSASVGRATSLLLASVSVAAAVVGAAYGRHGGWATRLGWVCLTLAWAIAGVVLLRRRGSERLGMLAIGFSFLAGVAALAAALARSGGENGVSALVLALAIALLPAALMHVLLALPAGALTGNRRSAAIAGYLIGLGVGVFLWTERPSLPAWPIVIEAAVAAAVGVNGVVARYRRAHGAERRGMGWTALSLAAALEVVLVGMTLYFLRGWPAGVLQVAAAATIPIPLGPVLERSRWSQHSVDRLLLPAISLVGLTAIVAGVYLLVVGGLGHGPTQAQRTLVLLSLVAAAVSAVLYRKASKRLAMFANQLVHGAPRSSAEVVPNLGANLSRAVPLEELLQQLAESLRSALALDAAEIWTGSGGMLDCVASDPEREPAWLRLTAAEESVVAGAGVSGPAWMGVWLPELLAERREAVVRVAPIAQSGELLGLVVVERAPDGDPFDESTETVLAELARRLGTVLRNVQLDARLQASLAELRRQAEELRCSRARVVAAGDAERRRIERDLHDGAQQHLVALEANLGAVQALIASDGERARAVLDELRVAVREAMQDFRDLAHGIYPPLLQDRGLSEALANAARRTTIPTHLEAPAAHRYEPEIEATVYFCCVEALQNAAKHAGEGARATIALREREGALLFEVADDGSGLDPGETTFGVGMTNMRDRLEAIGGDLRIESSRGAGTRVLGTIPLPG